MVRFLDVDRDGRAIDCSATGSSTCLSLRLRCCSSGDSSFTSTSSSSSSRARGRPHAQANSLRSLDPMLTREKRPETSYSKGAAAKPVWNVPSPPKAPMARYPTSSRREWLAHSGKPFSHRWPPVRYHCKFREKSNCGMWNVP
jgi:hypothetical protein